MRRAKAILRGLVPAAAAGALALGLAACGQAETGAGDESGGTARTAETAETPPLEGEQPRGDVGALTPIRERPGEAEDVVEDVEPSETRAPHVSSGPDEGATP